MPRNPTESLFLLDAADGNLSAPPSLDEMGQVTDPSAADLKERLHTRRVSHL
jgi:hypothetical protein